jgi:hypothetical protein
MPPQTRGLSNEFCMAQKTVANSSADESAGVGKDLETTVSEAYTPHTSHFSGKINKVTISLK